MRRAAAARRSRTSPTSSASPPPRQAEGCPQPPPTAGQHCCRLTHARQAGYLAPLRARPSPSPVPATPPTTPQPALDNRSATRTLGRLAKELPSPQKPSRTRSRFHTFGGLCLPASGHPTPTCHSARRPGGIHEIEARPARHRRRIVLPGFRRQRAGGCHRHGGHAGGQLHDAQATRSTRSTPGTHGGTITIGLSGDTTETAPRRAERERLGLGVSYTSIAISPTGGAARTISGAIAGGSPAHRPQRRRQRDLRRPEHRRQLADDLQHHRVGHVGDEHDPVHRRRDRQRGHQLDDPGLVRRGGRARTAATSTSAPTRSRPTATTTTRSPTATSARPGTNLPTKGIYCNGSTTTAAIGNSGIVIDNNNIYDYFGAAVSERGRLRRRRVQRLDHHEQQVLPDGHPDLDHRREQPGDRHPELDRDHGRPGIHHHRQHHRLRLQRRDGHLHLHRVDREVRRHRIQRPHRREPLRQRSPGNTITAVSLTGVTSSGTSTSSALHGDPGDQRSRRTRTATPSAARRRPGR